MGETNEDRAAYLRSLARHLRKMRETEEISLPTCNGGILTYQAYDQVQKERTVRFSEVMLDEAPDQLEKAAGMLLASVPAESWCERKKE